MTCMSIRVTLIQCSERGGSSAEAQDIHLGGGHWITKWVSNITMKGVDVGRCVGITFLTRHRYWRLQDGVWRGYTPGRIGSRRYWQNERKTGLTGRLLETSKGRNMCIDDAIPPLPFPPWFTLRTETLSIRHLEWPMPTIMQLATSGQKTKKNPRIWQYIFQAVQNVLTIPLHALTAVRIYMRNDILGDVCD